MYLVRAPPLAGGRPARISWAAGVLVCYRGVRHCTHSSCGIVSRPVWLGASCSPFKVDPRQSAGQARGARPPAGMCTRRRRRGLMGRGKASRSALPRFACVLPRPSMVAPPLAPEQGVQGRRQARKNDSFATQKSTKAGQLYCESLIMAALPAGDKILMKCQTLKACCRHTAKNSWHSSSTSEQCWRCDSCFNFGRFEDLWSSGDLFVDGEMWCSSCYSTVMFDVVHFDRIPKIFGDKCLERNPGCNWCEQRRPPRRKESSPPLWSAALPPAPATGADLALSWDPSQMIPCLPKISQKYPN